LNGRGIELGGAAESLDSMNVVRWGTWFSVSSHVLPPSACPIQMAALQYV
jgi:hypothetical protein